MLIQPLILAQILRVTTSATLFYDEEEIVQDWDDSLWETREGKQVAFPQSSTGECLGERMSLRAGESAVIKSHKSFGLAPYNDGFRCRWIFKPVDCDLGLVCHLQTRTARSGSRSCQGGDYVRIMKGRTQTGAQAEVTFHKKYCGKRTASLKFSGDETVKIVFKTSSNSRKAPAKLDGFTCRVVCLGNSKPQIKQTTTTTTTTTTRLDPLVGLGRLPVKCRRPGKD